MWKFESTQKEGSRDLSADSSIFPKLLK